jgi:hypothetical protein
MKKDKNHDSANDLEIVTEEIILNSLSKQYQSIEEIISNIKEAKDRIDYLYVLLKLMLLERKGIVDILFNDGKKFYKLN